MLSETSRLMTPQAVDGAVRGDAIDPGRESVSRIEAIEGLVDTDEHVLRHVQRHVRITDHAIDEIHDLPLMSSDQLAEQLLVPGQDLLHQFLVGRRLDGQLPAIGWRRRRDVRARGDEDSPRTEGMDIRGAQAAAELRGLFNSSPEERPLGRCCSVYGHMLQVSGVDYKSSSPRNGRVRPGACRPSARRIRASVASEVPEGSLGVQERGTSLAGKE